ncbi:MAG TPA: hypothetical protein PK916_09095 [Bacteroidota bacterium]|nr:hypothetical protein [Bacteroidota bacterium]
MRLFEILDKLNQMDSSDAGANAKVVVCPDFVSSKTTGRGVEITMGADASVNPHLMVGRLTPILVLVDMDEYKKVAEGGE